MCNSLYFFNIYTLDAEINAILSSGDDAPTVMRHLALELRRTKESAALSRKHNLSLQAEVARLQAESKSYREQLKDYVHSSQEANMEISELRQKNEIFI